MSTPHHKPKNVRLTNNLRWSAGLAPAIPNPTSEPKDVKPHWESALTAATRALDSLIDAGLVKPVVVRKAKASGWNPDKPRKKAPHWKARNVRLTGRITGTGPSASIRPDEWERIKPKQKQAHAAFAIASRALELMQMAALKAAA